MLRLPSVVVWIGLSVLVEGCGTLQQSATQTAPAGTATAPPATATSVASTASPVPDLTDTGYNAPDGSPLYAECVGTNPVTGQPLPLPPQYPTPAPFSPLPSPPSNPNPNPRPPDADLPQFDALAVTPSDSGGWARVSTPCLGGLSFAVPPHWSAIDKFAVGQYQTDSGGQFTSSDTKVKVDMSYSYDRDDTFTRFRNRNAGNGSYFLVWNAPASAAGAGFGRRVIGSGGVAAAVRCRLLSDKSTPKLVLELRGLLLSAVQPVGVR